MTVNPGYYTEGLSLTGGSSLTLRPGIYILGGPGLRISGGSSLVAQGVTIYLTGTAALHLSGDSSVTLTAPAGSAYEGIAVFQDRADQNAAQITGSSSTSLTGTFYLPSALTTITGNGGDLSITVITDRLTVTGSGSLTVRGSGLPSTGSCYLVQ
jgi:hypothetical protein